MRRPRYLDFECETCGNLSTLFVETNDDNTPLEAQRCASSLGEIGEDGLPTVYDAATPDALALCTGPLKPREMAGVGYMKTISKQNSDFNERERDRLEKRQADHWKRQGRDEAIDRERSFLKRMGAVGGVK